MTAADRWPSLAGASWGRRDPRQSRPAIRTVALTSDVDQLEHQIVIDELESVVDEPGAAVTACCGVLVLPSSLSTPPGRPCPQCAVSWPEPRPGSRRAH